MTLYRVKIHSGEISWRLDGTIHRVQGPAVEFPGVYKAWYLNGKRHRDGGPAIEGASGDQEWWINGKFI